MGAFGDWRCDPRVEIDGQAFWSLDRIEGSCRLINLSAGGVKISDPKPPLEVGAQLRVSLIIHQLRIESVLVEVVRISEDVLALRFLRLPEALQERLDQLIRDLLAG